MDMIFVATLIGTYLWLNHPQKETTVRWASRKH